MQAGTLDHLFTVKRPSETSGDAAITEPTVAKVWGSLEGIGGTEAGLAAQADFRIRARYRSDLTSRMVLYEGDRKFQINAPPQDPDGRRRELIITVTELQ
jgi:head-tail adaptor